ncbi:MAG: hypothetical protein DSY70_08030 [Desulfobulbus sp.]|nr:MAG: hypothetical protein DSY70_08030 [Desulfobulbus sp.]
MICHANDVKSDAWEWSICHNQELTYLVDFVKINRCRKQLCSVTIAGCSVRFEQLFQIVNFDGFVKSQKPSLR